MLTWIWIIYITATTVQLVYWLGVFSRLAYYRQPTRKEEKKPPPGVSVIICARNEAENLKKNLPHFLSQNYRSFEIIVINDHSTDETAQILLDFQNKSTKLRTVSLKDGKIQPGKKKALSKGIQIAKFDVILLSDADCFPASEHWLDEMQSILRDNIEIGLGYGPYLREKNNFLHLFICFETTYTATQYFSFALTGLPYMGVGRNLIYDKALFFRTGGFQKHEHLASGDDDLFINQAASFDNTAVNINPEAFVYSEPKRAWRGYYYQKARHLTTGSSYKPVHQFLLGGLSLSHFLHYLAALVLLFSSSMSSLVFLIYLVRIGVVSLILGKILKKLQDSTLIKWIPVLDFAFIAYYLLFAPSLLIGSKVKQWKP
jgi:glycosyltransferase involved in cell wall biosynthesis